MPDTNETALEKTFSDLAYSHLRDKSQSLLDYLVGFQMLKQEDDGARAVGIFGFEIDEDYYYAPVFFLNGEIRGLDSLYSVKSDLFMPLTDDWVNTIINRRQLTLGDSDKRSKSERGVHVPNYTRLKVIPGGGGGVNLKLSSAIDAMSGENPDLAVLRHVNVVDEINGAGMGGVFKAAMDQSPVLRKHFEDFGYNYFDLGYSALPQQKVAQEEAVILINSVTDEGVEELTDDQRMQVIEGGTAVIDNRPEIDKATLYRTEVQRELENPTCGTLYDVLWSSGEVTVCLVCPLSDGSNDVFVYCTESDKYCCIDRRKVFVTRAYTHDEMCKWLDEKGKLPSDVVARDVVVFISCEGEATAGFCIENVRKGLDGITVCSVHDKHYMCAGGDPCHGTRGDNGNPPNNMFDNLMIGGGICGIGNRPRDPNCYVNEIVVTESGGAAPRYTQEQCVVNDKRFTALKINSFRMVKEDNGEFQHEKYDEPRYDAQLQCGDFGDYNTVYQALDKVAADLKTWRTGSETVIKTAGMLEAVRTERHGLEVLMKKLGMSEDDARLVLKEAEAASQVYKLRPATKTAAEMLELPEVNDTDLGGFMTSFHRQQVPLANVNQGQTDGQNREFYQYQSPFGSGVDPDGDVDTMQVVSDAAQTGEKEVFDAAALGSLIKSHNPTDLVDRFLPTIIAGMDRIGRMLFLIYWHYEDFEERFGDDDLGEFLDNLKAVFEQLGDVVVFAKKRTLAGDPEHYGMGMMPAMEESAG